ncbi:60 kDa neurofilament protein-like isoform X2 [Tubulanus polymorphus]|uniref:60 kDa neurofilament protein-like isoform X2 n=1 Tax=Tubulanus polymorphus TaxID=672921 RepID=UPI003DA317BB
MSTQTRQEVTKSGNVTTTKTTMEYDDSNIPYRPITMARPIIHISRSTIGLGGRAGGSSLRASSVSASSSAPTGAFLKMTGMGSEQVKGQRVREKKDLQDLNGRLADYIEKMRFLEAQNRKLVMELDDLKAKWGKETSAIKAMFEGELAAARRLLDAAEKERSQLDVQINSLSEELARKNDVIEELQKALQAEKDLVERQNQQLADYETELNVLRRRTSQLEKDSARDKAEVKRLQGELARARQDLDNETLNRVVAENEKQSLAEEIEFLKQVHEQEMKELSALMIRDTTAENREYWKNELSQAVSDIQREYDIKLEDMRLDLNSYYDTKLNEFGAGQTRSNMETTHAKEEVKKLRTQVGDLRSKLADLEAKNAHLEKMYNELLREYEDKQRSWELEKGEMEGEVATLRTELESVLVEMQNLFDAKLSLELEIAAYRKLLEGEETRSGMNDIIKQSTTSGQQSAMMMTSGQSAMMMSGGGGSAGGGGGSSAGSAGGSMSMSSSSGMAGSAGGATKPKHHDSPTTHRARGNSSPHAGNKRASGGMKGEMSAKTTYQRSAKGNISINECSSDGRYIILENTGKKDEIIDGWHITRSIDHNRNNVKFTFPSNCKIGTGPTKNKLKIWAKGTAKNEFRDGDLEANLGKDKWGVGADIVTTLLNAEGEERATHSQKTIYT